MKKKIWQLALTKDYICPVCGNRLTHHRTYTVMLVAPDQVYKPYTCITFYCPDCDLPFVDSEIIICLQQKKGYWIRNFLPQSGCTAESIRMQMKSRKEIPAPSGNFLTKSCCTAEAISMQIKSCKEIPASLSQTEKIAGFDLVRNHYTIWKPYKFLFSYSGDLPECPNCHGKLNPDCTYIPVSTNEEVNVPGKFCSNCKKFHVEKSDKLDELIKLLWNNPLCKGFYFNGHALGITPGIKGNVKINKKFSNPLVEKRKPLTKTSDAKIIIRIESNTQIHEYIIANYDLRSHNIFSYKSEEGRELLSAAFAEKRNEKGRLFGSEFQIKEIVFEDEFSRDHSHRIMPVRLNIKADGGYSSSVINSNYEVVDLLVYSLRNQKYEILRGTYNKKQGTCFTDISLFRSFVREYGKPDIKINFSSAKSYDYSNFELREKSVLMEYGYNVSETNRLSDKERQEILSEIVDLGILQVYEIVWLLQSHCNLHSGERYWLARSKWQRDITYIENYKVNPDRFVITSITV